MVMQVSVHQSLPPTELPVLATPIQSATAWHTRPGILMSAIATFIDNNITLSLDSIKGNIFSPEDLVQQYSEFTAT